MNLHRAAVAAVATTLVLAGCAIVPGAGEPLTGTAWQLVAIDDAGSTTTLTPALQRRHTLAFDTGGELKVQLDCNRGRSTWKAGKPRGEAGAISLGPVASTRMACPQPSFGDRFAAGLSSADRYNLTRDGRQLVLEAPELRLTFLSIAE